MVQAGNRDLRLGSWGRQNMALGRLKIVDLERSKMSKFYIWISSSRTNWSNLDIHTPLESTLVTYVHAGRVINPGGCALENRGKERNRK